MKLTELNPRFIGSGGKNVFNTDGSPSELREGVALVFNCPCGKEHEEHNKECVVMFNNPLDGGKPYPNHIYWQRTGETFENLTLTPSILRSKERGGCGWHGFITNGEIITA